jgi:hypothetical protein
MLVFFNSVANIFGSSAVIVCTSNGAVFINYRMTLIAIIDSQVF